MRVEQLQAEYDVDVAWRGVEIHPEIPPAGLPLSPEALARFGGMPDGLREEAAQAGLPLVTPVKISKSRRALEAAEYAREQGQHEAFHKLVFRRFYGEGRDLYDWETLRATAVDVGLDPDEMQTAVESRRYKMVIARNQQEIFSMGATGVPLFIFDEKVAVVGLRPYAAFQEVMEYLAQEGES